MTQKGLIRGDGSDLGFSPAERDGEREFLCPKLDDIIQTGTIIAIYSDNVSLHREGKLMHSRNHFIYRTAVLVFFLGMVSSGDLSGFIMNARRVGMGGAFLCHDGDAVVCNPAYLALPQPDTPLSLPLPLGLLQLWNNFPVLNPDDPDFDPIYITNLLLNPPFHLQVLTPEYTTTEANVTVDISEDLLLIDLGDLQTYIPTEPVETGILSFRSPRLGKRFGNWSFSIAPLLIGEGNVSLSDNLTSALAEAEAFEANSRYDVFADGNMAVMASINASHGRRLPFNLLGKDNPIYLGGTAKYLLGWAYVDTKTEVAIITGDPVFDTDEPPDLEFTSIIRSSHPEWGTYSPSGTGFGFDMGLLAEVDRVRVGFGIQDVYSRITWEAEVERWKLNETTNEIKKKTLVPFEYYRQRIPQTYTISLAYVNTPFRKEAKQEEGYIIASNIDLQGGDVYLNLGSEVYVHSFPVRTGIFTETGKLQVSFGTAIPVYFATLDLGFATHNRTLSGKKGLYMASSLRFGAY